MTINQYENEVFNQSDVFTIELEEHEIDTTTELIDSILSSTIPPLELNEHELLLQEDLNEIDAEIVTENAIISIDNEEVLEITTYDAETEPVTENTVNEKSTFDIIDEDTQRADKKEKMNSNEVLKSTKKDTKKDQIDNFVNTESSTMGRLETLSEEPVKKRDTIISNSQEMRDDLSELDNTSLVDKFSDYDNIIQHTQVESKAGSRLLDIIDIETSDVETTPKNYDANEDQKANSPVYENNLVRDLDDNGIMMNKIQEDPKERDEKNKKAIHTKIFYKDEPRFESSNGLDNETIIDIHVNTFTNYINDDVATAIDDAINNVIKNKTSEIKEMIDTIKSNVTNVAMNNLEMANSDQSSDGSFQSEVFILGSSLDSDDTEFQMVKIEDDTKAVSTINEKNDSPEEDIPTINIGIETQVDENFNLIEPPTIEIAQENDDTITNLLDEHTKMERGWGRDSIQNIPKPYLEIGEWNKDAIVEDNTRWPYMDEHTQMERNMGRDFADDFSKVKRHRMKNGKTGHKKGSSRDKNFRKKHTNRLKNREIEFLYNNKEIDQIENLKSPKNDQKKNLWNTELKLTFNITEDARKKRKIDEHIGDHVRNNERSLTQRQDYGAPKPPPSQDVPDSCFVTTSCSSSCGTGFQLLIPDKSDYSCQG